jgi:hypothetical protein
LQYTLICSWRTYLFGEAAYIMLSLTAASTLPRQVFGDALTGSPDGPSLRA